MSTYNLDRLGKFMVFNRFIAFNFNHNRNKLITDIYDILFFAFKSMSCLISKPVFSFKTDKIIIHLFYFLVSPVFLKSHRRVNQFKLPHVKSSPLTADAAKFIQNKSIRQKNVRYFKNKLLTSQSQAQTQSKSTAGSRFLFKKTVQQKGFKHQIVHQNFFNILFKSKLQKVPLTFKKRNS